MIYDNVYGPFQTGFTSRTAIPGDAAFAGPHNSGDNTRASVDAANSVVSTISDEDIAGLIHGHATGLLKLRYCGRAAISGKAKVPRPCDQVDGTAVRIDPENAIKWFVCRNEVPVRVYRECGNECVWGEGCQSRD